jgi:hypothetical protein
MPTIETIYGPVDSERLNSLRGGFNTSHLLEVIALGNRFHQQWSTLRDRLMAVHAMARVVVDGAAPDPDDAPLVQGKILWHEADMLSIEFVDWVDRFKDAERVLDVLACVCPDSENEDGD